MMHGATVYQLGALLPEQEVPLKDMLGQIDALQQEALGDIRTLSDEGHNVSSFKTEWDAFMAQSGQLSTEFTLLDEHHIAAWKGRANAVVSGLMDLLARLGKAKQGGFSIAERSGLMWGFAASVAVAGIAFYVWRGKRRPRRRVR
jgi:hypothetical protein